MSSKKPTTNSIQPKKSVGKKKQSTPITAKATSPAKKKSARNSTGVNSTGVKSAGNSLTTKTGSTQTKTKNSSGSQSATERKLLEAQLKQLILRIAPVQLRLVTAMRKWIQDRLPTAFEIVYDYGSFFALSYSPSQHGYQGVLTVRASAEAVQLYFSHGKELSDPARLLRGTASVRYIDVTNVALLDSPEVSALIEGAIALNRIPFSNSGPGTIAMSPSTVKKNKK